MQCVKKDAYKPLVLRIQLRNWCTPGLFLTPPPLQDSEPNQILSPPPPRGDTWGITLSCTQRNEQTDSGGRRTTIPVFLARPALTTVHSTKGGSPRTPGGCQFCPPHPTPTPDGVQDRDVPPAGADHHPAAPAPEGLPASTPLGICPPPPRMSTTICIGRRVGSLLPGRRRRLGYRATCSIASANRGTVQSKNSLPIPVHFSFLVFLFLLFFFLKTSQLFPTPSPHCGRISHSSCWAPNRTEIDGFGFWKKTSS